MVAKIQATFHKKAEISRFLSSLANASPKAMAAGLNEHAEETRRQSVVRMAGVTKVPAGRIRGVTTVKKARPVGVMAAEVRTADKAIGLEEYGNPEWVRDLNPMAGGNRGGPVSSMPGVLATGWGNRRYHRGTFFAKGKVWKREKSGKLRKIYSTVLANELATPDWTNVKGAAKFMQLDLEKRVVRHIQRQLGI
ncbi:hypothetical protein [Maritalea porphyrae]|uniref:hypothetical protein n=1 Tax=Maritalea porphyrae TaxID=880732 RepID=UPI0022B070AE|nr:hypothetical protein [Maritalea porphyrae]MCZ4270732.1 hypothetical protein [Maritalea porphyrae]